MGWQSSSCGGRDAEVVGDGEAGRGGRLPGCPLVVGGPGARVGRHAAPGKAAVGWAASSRNRPMASAERPAGRPARNLRARPAADPPVSSDGSREGPQTVRS